MQIFLFRVVAGLLFCAVAAKAADASGTWAGFPLSFVLKQEGTKLTGSVGPSSSEQYPFENGKIDGDRLSFSLGKYQFDLRLEGDKIQGTTSNGGESVKVFVKRVNENVGPSTFDVASVKRAGVWTPGVRSRTNYDPGRLTMTNISLKRLIVSAYNLKEYQVIGPDWLNSELYDVAVTFPAFTSRDWIKKMQQPLLQERFKLAFHREMRELSIYALVVDKSGLKLKAVEAFDDRGVQTLTGPGGRQLNGSTSLDKLADALTNSVDLPVVNLTGVKGVFEVKLEWAPDDNGVSVKAHQGSLIDDAAGGVSVYAALHRAGLKLESRKAPIEVLVVDQAERVPIEN